MFRFANLRRTDIDSISVTEFEPTHTTATVFESGEKPRPCTGVGLLERNQRARHRIARSDHAEQAVVVRINGRREISALGNSAPRFVLDAERIEFCSDGGIGVTS